MSHPVSELFFSMEKAKKCRDSINALKQASLVTDQEREVRKAIYRLQMNEALSRTNDRLGPAMSVADKYEVRLIKSAYTDLLKTISVECVY